MQAFCLSLRLPVAPILCTTCKVSVLVIQAAQLPPDFVVSDFAVLGFAANFLQT